MYKSFTECEVGEKSQKTLMKPAREHEHNDEKKNTKKRQIPLEARARDIYKAQHNEKKKKEKYWVQVQLDGEEKHIPKAQ